MDEKGEEAVRLHVGTGKGVQDKDVVVVVGVVAGVWRNSGGNGVLAWC